MQREHVGNTTIDPRKGYEDVTVDQKRSAPPLDARVGVVEAQSWCASVCVKISQAYAAGVGNTVPTFLKTLHVEFSGQWRK